MRSRLIIDGNAVYEIDEDCMRKKRKNLSKGKDIFENDRKQQRERSNIQEGEPQ